MLEKQFRAEERPTLSFTTRMKKPSENRKRKRSVKIAGHFLSGIRVRRKIRMIRIIGVRDARRPCADYGARLVPNSESDVDGSYAGNTQRSSGKGKDYSLRDSVRSIASGHRSFDLFCYNSTGDDFVQG